MKFIYIVLLALCTAVAYPQDVKKLIAAAEAKEKSEDYKGALELYNQALKLSPADADLYVRRAYVNVWLENFLPAKNDLDKAIELQPAQAKYYFERGSFYNHVYQPQLAIIDCDNALKYPVTDIELRNNIYTIRGESKKFTADFVGAHSDYQEVLKNQPDAPQEMLCLSGEGFVLSELNRTDESLAALRILVKKYPKFTAGYLNLAFTLAEAGKYQEAIDVNVKALEMIKGVKRNEDDTYNAHKKVTVADNNEEMPVIYNNMGYAEYKLGLHEDALKDINTSLKMLPDNSYAYKNRALVYIAMKKEDLACADIHNALALEFTEQYGDEVKLLKQKHCDKQ